MRASLHLLTLGLLLTGAQAADPPRQWTSSDGKSKFMGNLVDIVGEEAKAWRDIWGCGQGIGAIRNAPPAGEFIARLIREYDEAQAELAVKTGYVRHARGLAPA